MQKEENNENSHAILTISQISFLLRIGFIVIMPTVTYTQFNLAQALVEYAQSGQYHYDCMAYYYSPFTKNDFQICQSRDIITLVIEFAITVAIFLYMAKEVRSAIMDNLRRKSN